MRILIVTSIYPTADDPGLGAFVASQVASLRLSGLALDVLHLDVRRSRLELPRGIAAVRTRARDYDIVHAHFGYNGLPAVLQARRPSVVSFCGTDLVSRKLRPLSRWVARRADACIVKSEKMRALLGAPAYVVPNGVDTEMFQPGSRARARAQLGLAPDKSYALFAADPMRPEKRFELAEAVLGSLKRRGVAIEPLILHKRPHSEVPAYLNASDLLILTSEHEGSPNVVKEAMACNLPIVSTDVGDVRQTIDGTRDCVIAEPSVESLADGISAVLQSGRRTDGRRRIEALSAGAVAEKIVGIYQGVLEGGTRT